MEPKTRINLTDIASSGVLSVLTQTYITYNGQETVLEDHREALIPGQFDRAKEILTENLYKVIEDLWTPEVVGAWEEKQKQHAEQTA